MRRSILLCVMASLLALPASAQSLFRGVLRVDNCSVEEVGDSLKVGFNVRVDREASRWFTGGLFTPAISDGDPADSVVHFTAMPDIMLLGRNKNRVYERSIKMLGRRKREAFGRPAAAIRVSAETDTIIYYNYAIPYEMWMDTARMVFYYETFGFRNERTLFAVDADGGVKLAPRTPYVIRPQVSFAVPDKEIKTRTKQGSAFLDFVVNQTVILPEFRRNPEELAKIHDALAEVQDGDGLTVTGLYIEGYASVEGSYLNNERLARGRAFALKDYIMSRYKLPLGEDRVRVSWTPEDWDGLRALVEQSDMPQREQVLAIINGQLVFDGRERELMRLAGGVPYRRMLRDMFPQGRRVEYQVDYNVREFTVRETELLVGERPHLLNQLELYNLAQNYGAGTDKYNELILDVIPRNYPGDATAAVNAAAVMIRNGEYAGARRTLEKFAGDPLTWNNMGIICMYDGDLDGAETLLRKAADSGIPEAGRNLDELRKKREDNLKMERYKR